MGARQSKRSIAPLPNAEGGATWRAKEAQGTPSPPAAPHGRGAERQVRRRRVELHAALRRALDLLHGPRRTHRPSESTDRGGDARRAQGERRLARGVQDGRDREPQRAVEASAVAAREIRLELATRFARGSSPAPTRGRPRPRCSCSECSRPHASELDTNSVTVASLALRFLDVSCD